MLDFGLIEPRTERALDAGDPDNAFRAFRKPKPTPTKQQRSGSGTGKTSSLARPRKLLQTFLDKNCGAAAKSKASRGKGLGAVSCSVRMKMP